MAEQQHPKSKDEQHTWEDSLIEETSEEKQGQRNRSFGEAALGLLFDRYVQGKNLRKAKKILKQPIDPKKLISDIPYKENIKWALGLVREKEKGRLKQGKSEFQEQIRRTSEALTHTNYAHEQQFKVKQTFSKYYTTDLKNVYGLGDKELKSVLQKAESR